MKRQTLFIILILALGLTACEKTPSAASTDTNLPETDQPTEEPVLITGTFEYSNEFVLETYYVEHAVMLTDMTSFILRDLDWELPFTVRIWAPTCSPAASAALSAVT